MTRTIPFTAFAAALLLAFGSTIALAGSMKEKAGTEMKSGTMETMEKTQDMEKAGEDAMPETMPTGGTMKEDSTDMETVEGESMMKKSTGDSMPEDTPMKYDDPAKDETMKKKDGGY